MEESLSQELHDGVNLAGGTVVGRSDTRRDLISNHDDFE
jgi:hypothetical protein